MRLGGDSAALAALALITTCPVAAQTPEPIVFQGEVFDLTGAGTFELPELDRVLKPFRREFRDGRSIALELVIDAAGSVPDCRMASGAGLSPAARALCAHVRTAGRFRLFPSMVLDYTRGTLRLTFRRRDPRHDDQSEFAFEQPYPFEGQGVRFGGYEIPPADQRLTLQEVSYVPMYYPSSALRNHIEAQVTVVLAFNETGRVESCRPVESSNTARIAYETCRAARLRFKLRQPPDARVFVFNTRWVIG